MGEERALSPFAVALRQARLSRMLSINDAAKATLLSDKQLLGLENDDYSYFYNASFARRSASTYACFLGVDPLLDGAPSRVDLEPPRLVASVDRSRSTSIVRNPRDDRRIFVFGFSFVVFLALAYSLRSCETAKSDGEAVEMRELQPSLSVQPDGSAPDSLTPSTNEKISADVATVEWVPLPVPSTGPSIETVEWDRDAKENRFFVVVKRPTSISATDSLNSALLSGEQQPTAGRRIVGKMPFNVVLNDAEAVEIYYLGSRVRPGGSSVKGISVSLQP